MRRTKTDPKTHNLPVVFFSKELLPRHLVGSVGRADKFEETGLAGLSPTRSASPRQVMLPITSLVGKGSWRRNTLFEIIGKIGLVKWG
jgi:hypothetical protein